MSERLTPEEIAAMRARCGAATEGPWVWRDRYDFGEHVEHRQQGLDARCDNITEGRISLVSGTAASTVAVLEEWAAWADDSGLTVERVDADFIAHARTDLPRALDEIDALTAERDAAVARGEALAEALRRAARAMAAEADSDEACDLPIQAHQWRDEVAAIESVLADPSPAARRHMERVAALERFWRAFKASEAMSADVAQANPDALSDELMERDGEAAVEFVAARDALRALESVEAVLRRSA